MHTHTGLVLSPEVLSMAGLAGAAPSMAPAWCQAGLGARGTCPGKYSMEPVLLQPPSPTAQCQPLCAPLLSDVGTAASELRCNFPCLSWITQLIKTPKGSRGSSAHRHLEFTSQGTVTCGVWSSNTLLQESIEKPNPNFPAVRRESAAKGCGDT